MKYILWKWLSTLKTSKEPMQHKDRQASPVLITCRQLCALTSFFVLQLKGKPEEAYWDEKKIMHWILSDKARCCKTFSCILQTCTETEEKLWNYFLLLPLRSWHWISMMFYAVLHSNTKQVKEMVHMNIEWIILSCCRALPYREVLG